MLAHQLPTLPPIDALFDRLPELLGWLETTAIVPALAPIRLNAHETRFAPAGGHFWNRRAEKLELIRFAGANRLLVEFDYGGRHRVAEPYSFRRKSTGNLLLYAWEQRGAHIKAFTVDGMTNVKATTIAFTPRFYVELTG